MVNETHDSAAIMTTRSSAVDVIVVGGGQAGISLSYYLQQEGVSHVVLERDRAFSSWYRRWDGFHANTPSWMNTLPVLPEALPGGDSDGFASREQLIDYFAQCLDLVDPPIRPGTEVTKVTQVDNSLWHVETADHHYEARAVAICTGALSTPRVPAIAGSISPRIEQIHSADYRAPEQISTDNVIVVGSGSSGVQICRLLAESRQLKSLHLAVSNVVALPRHVLGIPTHRFFHFFRMFDWRIDTRRGKMMYSNLGSKGTPITGPGRRTSNEILASSCTGDSLAPTSGSFYSTTVVRSVATTSRSYGAPDSAPTTASSNCNPRTTRLAPTGARFTSAVSRRRPLACTSSVSCSSTRSPRTTSMESPATLATSLNTYPDDSPAPRFDVT